MRQKGGSCAPCRRSKEQCDDHDHCQSCIHKKISSEADILASMESPTYISLRELDQSTLPNDKSPAEVCSDTMIGAREQTIHHVNDWFKMVSENIDRGPFFNEMFRREVSLGCGAVNVRAGGERRIGSGLRVKDPKFEGSFKGDRFHRKYLPLPEYLAVVVMFRRPSIS